MNPIQKCAVNAAALALSAGSDVLFFTGIGAELKAAQGLSKLGVALSAKAGESIGYTAVRFNTNAAIARTMLRGGLNLAKIGGEGAVTAGLTGESYGWGNLALDAVLDFLPVIGTKRAGWDTIKSCAVVVNGFVH